MARIKEFSTYTAIKDCYFANKYFRVGDPWPEEWLRNGVPPGKHFCRTDQAAEVINSAKLNNQALSAGDDKRSNDQLRAELTKHMGKIPETWGRKQMWMELAKRDSAIARTQAITEQHEGKGKK